MNRAIFFICTLLAGNAVACPAPPQPCTGGAILSTPEEYCRMPVASIVNGQPTVTMPSEKEIEECLAERKGNPKLGAE